MSEMVEQYPALRWFATEHLRDDLKPVVESFGALAHQVAAANMRSAEVSVTIRKLVEAKDAAVRALIISTEAERGEA